MGTRIGRLAQELSATNPWWRTPTSWAQLDRDLGAVRDSGLGYEAPSLRDLVPGRLYVLRGPRRVGKTVAVKQTIGHLIQSGIDPRAIVRIAADGWDAADIRQLPRLTGLPRLAEGTRRWWFLDEVTGVKGDWGAQIKWLRDNDTGFGGDTVILTGSDAGALTGVVGELPGRRGENLDVARDVLPIGFRTFVKLVEREAPDVQTLPLAGVRSQEARRAYDDLVPWLDQLVRAWETYLEYGGFPTSVAAAKAGDAVPLSFVNDMFDVIFRDAFSASSLSENRTGALYARVMAGMANPLSTRAVAADLDLTHPTVERHVRYLREAILGWGCPLRSPTTWLALMRSQEKFYSVDPLLARLMHLRNDAFPDIDPTILTEMQVGMAIRRRQVAHGEWWTREDRLFYWRTPARKEIDFISSDLGDVAIEGKYTEGNWRRDAATVNASRWRGILATRNVLDTDDQEGAWAVPAAFLAYELDT